jgi:two-component sensor histidine kinase
VKQSGITSAGAVTRHGRAKAIRLANITLSGQDRNLRFLWIENPPPGFLQQDFTGRTDAEIFDAELACAIMPVKLDVLRTGEARATEFAIQYPEGPHWYELRVTPSRNNQGDVTGIVCAAIDVTERKQQESHLRVLLLELAHRSKNLLAVIQGIANQTAQGSETLGDFQRRFSGRILSLSRAHDILTDQNWRGAGMRELIRSQVLLFAGPAAAQVSYEGDAVYLRPSAAQHVGLALYELTTNAMKYGALSNSCGRVKIHWHVHNAADPQDDKLAFRWEEHNGPHVPEPGTRHFGRILLEEVVPLSVQGDATLAFTPDGISYELVMSASELT